MLRQLEEDQLSSVNTTIIRSISTTEFKPLSPKFDDLCRLHYIILSRKVLNVLEFGSGYSTAIMASAMSILDSEFHDWAAQNLRVEIPFKVFAVEEDKYFTDITNKRLCGSLEKYAEVSQSSVSMTEYDFRYCTTYDNLPNISPDFIYLDGPSQFANSKNLNGFDFRHICRMPMAADILKFEFFLEPVTLILVDGRTQNASFLKAYLRRSWGYAHDSEADIHTFELKDKPLGRLNERKIRFCLGESWNLKTI